MKPQLKSGEVVDFLHSRGLTRLTRANDTYYESELLSNIAEDQNATKGELSWISPKVLLEDPLRITRFQGSLLICPSEHSADPKVERFAIPCDRPRLAFAEVVSVLFADKLAITWPQSGDSPISPDTKIGARVMIAAGAVIGPGVVIGDDVSIGPNSCIANTTIASGVRIGCNCSIGLPGFGYEKREDGTFIRFPQLGRVFIDVNVEIGSNTCIDRAALGVTHIAAGAKIDNLVHIAHNVRIGRNTLVIADTMIGGSTVVGDNVWLAPSSSLMNKIRIGDRAIVGLGAIVTRSVQDDTTVVGNPAKPIVKKET